MSAVPRKVYIALFVFAAIKLAMHLYVNAFAGYGIFRDELYYLACADHPALGYVDQPPLSIWFLGLWRIVFGDSVFAIRFVPALLGAATVYFAGYGAIIMGGGITAAAIAALGSGTALIFLSLNAYYSMNAFDILLWTLAGVLIIRIVLNGRPRDWIVLGMVIGLGLLNKISMLWFGFGLFCGLLLTPERRWLKTKWPYLAALIALGLFSPYIIWNALHGFPHLEFMHNAVKYKYSGLSAMSFLSDQLIIMNPMNALIWIGGLGFLLFAPSMRKFRIIGIIWCAVCAILVINGNSKAEYLAAAYPLVFAGAGILTERLATFGRLGWLRYVVPVLMIAGMVALAPLSIPILPVETYIAYAARIGQEPDSDEGKKLAELPQFYADMHGWENMAQTVAEAYKLVPPEEKAHTVVYGQNYGEAGAIDYFSGKYDLPPAISGHNNYFLWGLPEGVTTVIVIGEEAEDHENDFRIVTQAGVIHSPYAIPYENNLKVFVCRKPFVSLENEAFPETKHYD